MGLANIRVLGICLTGGFSLGTAGGLLWALFGEVEVAHAVGTGLLVVGLIALFLGLLGATEPPEGWSRKRSSQGRRSLVGRVAEEHPRLEPGSSASLAVWGVFVGGGLIGLSMLFFNLAAG